MDTHLKNALQLLDGHLAEVGEIRNRLASLLISDLPAAVPVQTIGRLAGMKTLGEQIRENEVCQTAKANGKRFGKAMKKAKRGGASGAS